MKLLTTILFALSIQGGAFAIASAIYYQDRAGGSQSGLMAGIALASAFLCLYIVWLNIVKVLPDRGA